MSNKSNVVTLGVVSKVFCVSSIKRTLGSLKDRWTTIKASRQYSVLSKVWTVLMVCKSLYHTYELVGHLAHYISQFIC